MSLLPIAKALLLGTIGGACFSLAGIPLAWMLGALAFTAVGGRLLGPTSIPRWMRDGLVPVLGVLLGSAFNPAILQHAAAWAIGLLVVVLYVAAVTALGFLYFRKVAAFDRMTAFFVSVPGGLSDVTLIGAALGADLGRLALVHTMRLVVVVATVPLGIALLGFPSAPAAAAAVGRAVSGPWDLAALLVCAVAGFGLGRALRLPAAPMIGPVLVSATVHMTGIAAIAPPFWLVVIAQIVLGAYIGSRLADMAGGAIRHAALHGVSWGLIIVVLAFATGFLGAAVTGISAPSMLLGLSPGGLPEMAVLTLSLGVDVAFVTLCHLVRLVVVYLATPIAVSVGGWSVPPSGSED